MPQHSLQQYPIPTESLAAAQEAAAFIATQLTTVLIDQAHNSIKNSSILYSNSTYSATAPTTTSSTPILTKASSCTDTLPKAMSLSLVIREVLSTTAKKVVFL